MRFLSAIVAAVLILGASSARADPGHSLWGPLRSGMTKTEVKAAQPSKLVKLSDTCSGLLGYQYADGKLSQVVMTSDFEGMEKQCNVLVSKVLAAKYGDDAKENRSVIQGNCGCCGKVAQLCSLMGGDTPVIYVTFDWVVDGVDITFKIQQGSPDWSVTYRLDPQATPDTLSKF
jgi:hypothetical protein